MSFRAPNGETIKLPESLIMEYIYAALTDSAKNNMYDSKTPQSITRYAKSGHRGLEIKKEDIQRVAESMLSGGLIERTSRGYRFNTK